MLLYRARREEWEKELRKKHVHKCVGFYFVRLCMEMVGSRCDAFVKFINTGTASPRA